jgi:hypothetical protein
MKLLGAYIPATAAMGFTTESAEYSGAPGSAPATIAGPRTSETKQSIRNIE